MGSCCCSAGERPAARCQVGQCAVPLCLPVRSVRGRYLHPASWSGLVRARARDGRSSGQGRGSGIVRDLVDPRSGPDMRYECSLSPESVFLPPWHCLTRIRTRQVSSLALALTRLDLHRSRAPVTTTETDLNSVLCAGHSLPVWPYLFLSSGACHPSDLAAILGPPPLVLWALWPLATSHWAWAPTASASPASDADTAQLPPSRTAPSGIMLSSCVARRQQQAPLGAVVPKCPHRMHSRRTCHPALT